MARFLDVLLAQWRGGWWTAVKHMARKPLVVLPSGHLIFAEDLPRLSPKAKTRVQATLMFLGFLLLIVLGSFDGVAA